MSRTLTWTTTPASARNLRRAGYRLVSFSWLRSRVRRARAVGAERSSLANPAARLLARLNRGSRLAILDVPCAAVADLAVLVGYVVEPTLRRGGEVLVQADASLDSLASAGLDDPDWRYPWTIEKLLWLAQDFATVAPVAHRRRWPPWASTRGDTVGRLDPEQSAAVRAGDGVVQVIAPAGSGKTTVLVARVRELLARGASPAAILCTTFNKDAVREMSARLAREGLAGVEVRSFHGLGYWILREERQAAARIGTPTFAQWRLLARRAAAAEPQAPWIDAAEAQNAVSRYKLVAMIDPAEALARADDVRERTLARLFELHERLLAAQSMLDFDDLIARAVALLRRDAAVRRRWQSRFARVLVDEYQDIEPAQALLVGLLAAPQDSLFCVGDEDQCIYAWRRATVQRVIELDQTYPGLERYPLVRNYRCGRTITTASRRLIEHNRQRFRKPLRSGAKVRGEIVVTATVDRTAGAAVAAERVATGARGQLAVVARTSALLREVAVACAARGIAFASAEKVIGTTGARGAVEAYLRLLAQPAQADAGDLAHALRTAGGAVGEDAAARAVARVRSGSGFAVALAAASVEGWRRERLASWGRLLDLLAAEPAADRVIAILRTDGGLDRHFTQRQRLDATERVDLEVLAALEQQARGRALVDFARALGAQTTALRAHRRDDAVELTTIHGAKGREWDHVVLYGADEGQLPHAQSMGEGDAGEEDERRLGYVAMTRARLRLEIICTAGRPSRFVAEAGLAES